MERRYLKNVAQVKKVGDVLTILPPADFVSSEELEERVTVETERATAAETGINDALSQFRSSIEQRLENIENLPPDLITSINAYYAMRRTGKVYQTKLWKFSTNTSPAGVKLLDNADLVCQPSTDTVEGRDDYADIPLFQWVNVNYIREADGTPVPVAIEGQPGYKTEGAVDVGAMQMSFWWNWEDFEEYSLVTISDMPHPELGLKPWPECVRADGSVTEYCIGSKYMAGLASDGLYRSQPNIPLWNKTCSHNALVTQMQKKGAGYWGAGIAHWSFAPVMLAIKYGTKNSQSVMQGCYGYSVTSYASQAENGVKRVIVPNVNYVVGSYIQIGSATTDVGRSNAAGYDIIDHARIASIESAGTGLYALNLDIDKTINVPSGAVVYSTPYNGGDTDTVIGRHDGSRLSNTDSKHPFRIQGREYAVGAYNISADVAMFNTANCDKEVFWAKRGVAHSTADATIRATYKKVGELFGNAGTDYWVGDITMDTESGALLQVAPIGSSNATGWCDRFYAGGTDTTGSREFLQGCYLGGGPNGGSCCLDCGGWLGSALWNVAARD